MALTGPILHATTRTASAAAVSLLMSCFVGAASGASRDPGQPLSEIRGEAARQAGSDDARTALEKAYPRPSRPIALITPGLAIVGDPPSQHDVGLPAVPPLRLDAPAPIETSAPFAPTAERVVPWAKHERRAWWHSPWLLSAVATAAGAASALLVLVAHESPTPFSGSVSTGMIHLE
jgi:hypothetical protein